MNKKHMEAFDVGTYGFNKLFEYVNNDVWISFSNVSLYVKFYYVSFINNYSRYVWIWLLTRNNEMFATFKSWSIQVEI